MSTYRPHPWVNNLNRVWEIATLNWVVMTQPGGGAGGGGDASAANQVLGNASLSAINTKTPALGQALAAASVPIVLTAIQVAALTPPAALTTVAVTNVGTFAVQVTSAPTTAVTGTFWQATQPVSGTLAVTSAGLTNIDVALSTRTKPADQQHAIIDSGTTTVTQATGTNLHVVVDSAPSTAVTGSVTANAGTNLNTSALALEAGHLATIDTSTAKIPSQGQALAGASLPVVLTAIQAAALTPPAAITGFALEAGHLAAIDTATARIPAQGQALAAAALPVVLTALQVTALTPLAAVTDAVVRVADPSFADASAQPLRLDPTGRLSVNLDDLRRVDELLVLKALETSMAALSGAYGYEVR